MKTRNIITKENKIKIYCDKNKEKKRVWTMSLQKSFRERKRKKKEYVRNCHKIFFP